MGIRIARWHLELIVLTLVWGLNFAWIEVAIDSFSPVQIAFGRLAIGGLLVTSLAIALRVPWPTRWTEWWHLAVAGVLTAALPCTLVPLAQESVTSITAGMINASAPLFAVALGVVLMWFGWNDGDRLVHRSAISGLILGFGGVMLLFSNGDVEHTSIGMTYAVAAAAAHGFGAVYVRRFLTNSRFSDVVMAAAQQIAGAIVLTGPLLASDLDDVARATGRSWIALITLAVLSSGIAYVLYYDVIRAAGATTAASVMYLMPIVSTSAGVIALDERVNVVSIIGGLVIVVGVVWSARAGGGSSVSDQASTS